MNIFKGLLILLIICFATLAKAKVQSGWSCDGVISAYYKNATEAPVYFDDEKGVITINFGKTIDSIQVGDYFSFHGYCHKVMAVESIKPGFKWYEFKTVPNSNCKASPALSKNSQS